MTTLAKLSALYADSMNQELPDNGGKMGMYPYIKSSPWLPSAIHARKSVGGTLSGFYLGYFLWGGEVVKWILPVAHL